ncbi:MAG: hypothetical protein Kow0065_18850 [Methylomicrobium sp.]
MICHRLLLNLALMFGVLMFSVPSRAEDTLYDLMQRMQTKAAVRIAYTETRSLELLDSPWLGSGYLYSLPPDLMLKQQLQPERVLMAVQGQKLFYFDPNQDIRRQAELDIDNPLTLNLAVFKALVGGDEALLYKIYRVDFNAQEQGWMMTLKSKRSSDSDFRIVISGPAGQQAESLVITQADGDSSRFTLRQDAEGAEVASEVTHLLEELLGK